LAAAAAAAVPSHGSPAEPNGQETPADVQAVPNGGELTGNGGALGWWEEQARLASVAQLVSTPPEDRFEAITS
jgi:hypothetical protein